MSAGPDRAQQRDVARGGRYAGGRTLAVVYAFLVVLIAVSGRLYYDTQRATLMTARRSELTSIRDAKAAQIVQWRASLLDDGRVLSRDVTVSNEIDAWLSESVGGKAESKVRAWIENLASARGYVAAWLIATDGSRWVATNGRGAPDSRLVAEAGSVVRSLEPTITELYLDGVTGVPRLDVAAPLSGTAGTMRAVIVLERDPEAYLYPLIQTWPVPSPTSETLLLRRDGDRVLFINELRFRSDSALRFALPSSNTALPAVQALTGAARVVEGTDYRGVPVIAAVGPIEGSDWFIVAKTDQTEAYAAVDSAATSTLVAAGLIALAFTLAFAVVWRQGKSAVLRQQLESERIGDERLNRAVQGAPVPIMIHAEDGEVIQVNGVWEELTGYAREDIPTTAVWTEKAYGRHAESVREDIEALYGLTARKDEGEYTVRIADGSERIWEFTSAPLGKLPDGRRIVMTAARDDTERKTAESELTARTEELERSNAELERFAYVASHDLQEPLRMVASYTQLLQQRYAGRLDSDADEFIAYAVDGATRMRTLINDLLSYSRVGTQGAVFVETDLEELLSEILLGLEATLREAGAVVTHDPLPTLSCDPTQIGQVFQNLISNAAKFHGTEPPLIHVGAQERGPEWLFSVRDNGIGIDPQYFDRIFVIFQRLESRSKYPGTGMGLAICKRVIGRHGGRIWVESTPGAGSTFFFTLKSTEKEHS